MTPRNYFLVILFLALLGCTPPTAQPTVTPSPAIIPSPSPTSNLSIGLTPDIELVATLPAFISDLYGFSWAPKGTRLAFFSPDGLHVAEAPRFEPRIIAKRFSGTTLWPDNTQPKWSPRGDRIAFTAPTTLPGEDWSPMSIWLVNADGSGLQDLLPGEKAVLSVSTAKVLIEWLDDRTLAFREHKGTGVDALFLLDVESGELTPVTLTEDAIFGLICGTVYYFSPVDKKTVVAECWGRGGPEVALLNLTSREIIELYGGVENYGDWEAFEAWAPDGSAFIFTRWVTELGEETSLVVAQPVDLYLWDVEKEEARLLAPNASWGAWSAGGQAVAFYLFGEPQLDSEGRITGTDFQPGKETRVYLGILDPASRKLLAQVPASGFVNTTDYNNYWGRFSERRPVWSPDGQRVIFWRTDGALMITSADGSELEILATNQAGVSNAVWSPNGEYLALGRANNEIWVVRLSQS